MNFLNSSLKLSNKFLGAPLLFFVNGSIERKYHRIVKNRGYSSIDQLRNNDAGHVIAYIKFGPEKEHQHVAYKAEQEVGDADEQDRYSQIGGEKDIVELAHNKAQVHIDQRKKANISSKEDVH